MGLLDDAIRDHLDLKRRRGADPSEIAREEREALEPVFPDEPRPAALDEEPQALVSDPEPPQGDPLAESFADEHQDPAEPVTAVGQETAELDMEAVLEQDARLTAAAPADEELEWEVPAHSGDGEAPPQPLPGQESLTFE